MTEKQGPPPEPMEWHDNLEAALEATPDLVDVANIVQGKDRVLTVRTSKGSLLFKKVSSLKTAELAGKNSDAINEAQATSSAAITALEKPDAEKTPEDWKAIGEFSRKGLPWSLAIAHASLVKPVMDRDTFDEFVVTLPREDQERIFGQVAKMYAPSEDVKDMVKRIASVSARYGIPLGDGLTMGNLPADLFLVLDEQVQKERQEVQDALRR